MEKTKIFEPEIKLIKDERLRNNLEIIINNLPDYFFIVPASSTGKYHPAFSLGEGGLLRHSKVAFRIGLDLLDTVTFGSEFTDNENNALNGTYTKTGDYTAKDLFIDHGGDLEFYNLEKYNGQSRLPTCK